MVAFQTIPGMALLGRGVLTEYVRVPSGQAARLFEGVEKGEGMGRMAGVVGCGATALKMVRVAAQGSGRGLGKGGRVLVNGASGSVGQVLVQVLKLRGVVVVGVASGGNEELVRGRGVDEVGHCFGCCCCYFMVLLATAVAF